MGAAARGKRHRYRYYVCWSRSRYGRAACTGERIRADALEAAAFDALVEFYALARVLAEGRQQSAAAARQHDKERRAIEAELKRTEAAVERYMHAFENGALTEDLFAERVPRAGHEGSGAPLPSRWTARRHDRPARRANRRRPAGTTPLAPSEDQARATSGAQSRRPRLCPRAARRGPRPRLAHLQRATDAASGRPHGVKRREPRCIGCSRRDTLRGGEGTRTLTGTLLRSRPLPDWATPPLPRMASNPSGGSRLAHQASCDGGRAQARACCVPPT